MLILAHRGDHEHAPENSLSAIEAARARGFDGVEIDLRLSADGQLVLQHDRVTPQGREVAQLARNDLQQHAGHAVASLPEVLACLPPHFLLNIEIKVPAAAPALERLLRSVKARPQLMLSSFHHAVVMRLSQNLNLPGGYLLAHQPADLAACLRCLQRSAAVQTLIWDFDIVDETLLQRTHELGWQNWVYGPGTIQEHTWLHQQPVRAMITDHAAALQLRQP